MSSDQAGYLDAEYFGFEQALGSDGVLTVTFNRPRVDECFEPLR